MTKLEKYTEAINNVNGAVLIGSEKQNSFTNLYFTASIDSKESIEEKLNDYAFKSSNNLMIEVIGNEYFFTFINR